MTNLLVLIFIILIFIFYQSKSFKIGKILGLQDIPGKNKIHKKITPLIGGFPIIFLILLFLIFRFKEFDSSLIAIIMISIILFIIGLVDDIKNLNANFKLFLSLIIFIIPLFFFKDLMVNKIYSEIINKHFLLKELSYPITILCLLLLINAVNLSDGINGLTCGTVCIWSFFLTIYSSGIEKSFFLFLAFILFINSIYIFRGKYFLGNSGSLFLGSIIGLSTIYIYNFNYFIGNQFGIEKIFIMFMVPGIDMFRLFIVRISNRKNPFSRDLNHLHHLLILKYGLSSSLIIYFSLIIICNLLSYLEIINSFLIIFAYSIIYILYIFFNKKNFKQTS